jgi:hypothetical protein
MYDGRSARASLNGPEGKLFSCFNAGILKIDQIKMSVVT